MGKLTDILRNDDDALRDAWDNTEAAGDYGTLPAATYIAHIVRGELTTSKSKETPGYKLTFQVIEGQHAGRRFWHDCWLTTAALPATKRDLSKLGVTSLEQLEQPLPKFFRCKVELTKRHGDDGNEFNHVRTFEVLSIDKPEPDTFAPDNDQIEDRSTFGES